MNDVLIELEGRLSRGESVALVRIISARGSLPMSRRSRLLVMPDGAHRGTVGGGCLEAEVVALARRALQETAPLLARFTLTEERAGAEGLNCGGTVQMLIEPLGPSSPSSHAALAVLRQGLAAVQGGDELVLATLLEPAPGDEQAARVSIQGYGLVGWSGLVSPADLLGTAAGGSAWLVEEATSMVGQDACALVEAPAGSKEEGSLLFVDSLSRPPVLYLFGGGHVGLAVAKVARIAGFRLVVIDDRPAFSNPARFPDAEATHVMPMRGAVSRLPISRDAYIVVVTRGHQHDEPVIEEAIRTPAAYIGMIGSRRKVAVAWERLRARGATPEQLGRVHAPIGLDIGADTPGEIAVSIVAQMISWRRGSPASTAI